MKPKQNEWLLGGFNVRVEHKKKHKAIKTNLKVSQSTSQLTKMEMQDIFCVKTWTITKVNGYWETL